MHGPFDLRIEEVELPELKPDQILIQLGACGICGSDVECFEGKSAEGRYDIAPYTPGHEWAGKAVAVGSNVTSVQIGNKVVGDCVLPCFQCANCKDGKMPSACLNWREVGFRPNSLGGFGEYMMLEEEDMIAAIQTAGDRLGYFHVADSTRWYPGRGIMNFPALMDALDKIDYKGYVSVECFRRGDGYATAQKAILYLKQLENDPVETAVL